jgi:hypothetical protein
MYEQNQVVPDLASALNLLEQQRLTINQLNGVIEDLQATIKQGINQVEFIGAHVETWAKRWNKAKDYLQASIDREEWDNDELAEPFWEELAEMFDLDLKRTKEVEFKVTLTYFGSATVPFDCDIESDIEIEGVPNELEFMLNRELLDDQTCNWDSQEIEAL